MDKDGNYNPLIKPNIVSFSDIMNGKSTNKANAVYEVYTQGVPPSNNH